VHAPYLRCRILMGKICQGAIECSDNVRLLPFPKIILDGHQIPQGAQARTSSCRKCGIQDMSTTACQVEFGSSDFAASLSRSLC